MFVWLLCILMNYSLNFKGSWGHGVLRTRFGMKHMDQNHSAQTSDKTMQLKVCFKEGCRIPCFCGCYVFRVCMQGKAGCMGG